MVSLEQRGASTHIAVKGMVSQAVPLYFLDNNALEARLLSWNPEEEGAL